jgi:hypothetical protein
MNRWTGTAHLTRDPELVTTSGRTHQPRTAGGSVFDRRRWISI